jgi:hypothetical protein
MQSKVRRQLKFWRNLVEYLINKQLQFACIYLRDYTELKEKGPENETTAGAEQATYSSTKQPTECTENELHGIPFNGGFTNTLRVARSSPCAALLP